MAGIDLDFTSFPAIDVTLEPVSGETRQAIRESNAAIAKRPVPCDSCRLRKMCRDGKGIIFCAEWAVYEKR